MFEEEDWLLVGLDFLSRQQVHDDAAIDGDQFSRFNGVELVDSRREDFFDFGKVELQRNFGIGGGFDVGVPSQEDVHDVRTGAWDDSRVSKWPAGVCSRSIRVFASPVWRLKWK